MTKREYQSGFGVVGILAIAVAVLAISGIGYVVLKKEPSSTKTSTTANSKPAEKGSLPKPSEQPKQQTQTNEKRYVNDRYGISFSYPADWRVEERDPATSSLEYYKTVLSVWLLDTRVKPEVVTAELSIHARDLESVTAVIDDDVESHATGETNYKQSQSFKGKDAVKYSIPQSKSVNRIMYYISGGQKTYAIQTDNEDTNIKNSPNYVDKFNKMVDSLRLPQ